MRDPAHVDWTEYEEQAEFNEVLDAGGTVNILSFNFLPSRVVYLMEPDGYREAANDFEVNRIENLMQVAQVCLDHGERHNKARFDELVEVARRSQLVPFIGAGLTVATGMPSWRRFILDCADDANLARADIEALIDSDQYEEAAHQVYQAVGADVFSSNVRDVFGRPQRPVGAVRLLPKIAKTCLITTNFDRTIETVFERLGQKLERAVGPEADEFHEAILNGGAYLLKIHGDAILARHRVLSREQYDAAYGAGDPDTTMALPRALAQVFVSRPMLFLGCSLQSDRTLSVFRQVKESQAVRVHHFAIVEHPGDPGKRAFRERFLQSHSIKPIWYPYGEHDCVEGLLHILSRRMGAS